MDMTTDAMTWTIAYRKRTANRFLRVSNWQGTWTQAVAMAAVFSETNPELQVYYVPTAEAEQDGATPEDIGNVLVDSGKRIRIAEGGGVPDEMIARIPTPEAARERWLDGTEIASPAQVATDHDEALAIAASIPVDGRPAEVTRLLEAAELLTDERENLAALQHARKVYDEHLAALPVPVTVSAVEIVDGVKVPIGEPRTTTVSRGALDLLYGECPVPNPHPLANCGPLTLPLASGDHCPTCGTRVDDRADLGGPGTSQGLIEAVESASTITAEQLDRAVFAAANTSCTVNRACVRAAFTAVGIDVR
jgi:hypothetical protein